MSFFYGRGVVIVPARAAAGLAAPLRRVMDELRNGHTFTDEEWAVSDAFSRAAEVARGIVGEVVDGVVGGLHPGRVESVSGGVTVLAAAALLGCSRQAVTKRLRSESLKGHKDDRGRWLVELEGAK